MRSLALFVGLILAAGTGCSDDDAKQPLTVWVFDEPLGPGDVGDPIAGARVAFDPPGGGARIEARTAGDGHVTFVADFRRGRGTVSAYSPEHTVVSALDAAPRTRANDRDKPSADIVLVLPRLDEAFATRTRALRGTVTGKPRTSDVVDVSVTGLRRSARVTTEQKDFALRARLGEPSTLVAHVREQPSSDVDFVSPHVKSFTVAIPPGDGDVDLDLDFASQAALPVTTSRLAATAPPSFAGDGLRCSATHASVDARATVGLTVRSRPTSKSTCEVDVASAAISLGAERLATRVTIVSPSGATSTRTELGVAPDGTALDGFLEPPRIEEASRNLANTIALGAYPAGTSLHVEVFAAGQLVWILDGPDGAPPENAILDLPAPYGLDFSADVQLLAVSVTVRSERIPGTTAFRREATSPDVIVRRL